MSDVTVEIDEETATRIEELAPAHDSTAAFLRACLRAYDQRASLQGEVADLRAENELLREQRDQRADRAVDLKRRVLELQEQLDEKERTIDRLRDEKQAMAARQDGAEHRALIDESPSTDEPAPTDEHAQADRQRGLGAQLKRWLLGVPQSPSST